MQRKIIYLNEIHIDKIISIWVLGVLPNKPYLVLDEFKRKFFTKSGLYYYESRYKIRDDYGNDRWVDSTYFFDYDEWRHERIKRILE